MTMQVIKFIEWKVIASHGLRGEANSNNWQNANMDKGEIIIYQADDKTTQFEVRIEDDTVWLTQIQMVDLFGRDRTVITRHINNIFKESELVEKSNVHFLHNAISDKPVKLYSLDVIISVGYRIKSSRGTQFRIWANRISVACCSLLVACPVK
jgi:hypothetical protein